MNTKSSSGQWILSPKAGENNFEEIHKYIENPDEFFKSLTPTPSTGSDSVRQNKKYIINYEIKHKITLLVFIFFCRFDYHSDWKY